MPPFKLTHPQEMLLCNLPDSSGGVMCKGSQARVANSLVARGLAMVVRTNEDNINWYTRTTAGRERAGLPPLNSQSLGYMQGRGAA